MDFGQGWSGYIFVPNVVDSVIVYIYIYIVCLFDIFKDIILDKQNRTKELKTNCIREWNNSKYNSSKKEKEKKEAIQNIYFTK